MTYILHDFLSFRAAIYDLGLTQSLQKAPIIIPDDPRAHPNRKRLLAESKDETMTPGSQKKNKLQNDFVDRRKFLSFAVWKRESSEWLNVLLLSGRLTWLFVLTGVLTKLVNYCNECKILANKTRVVSPVHTDAMVID